MTDVIDFFTRAKLDPEGMSDRTGQVVMAIIAEIAEKISDVFNKHNINPLFGYLALSMVKMDAMNGMFDMIHKNKDCPISFEVIADMSKKIEILEREVFDNLLEGIK